jgi:transcription elongation factor GreA
MAEEKQIFITKEGYDQLVKELESLKTEGRKRIAMRLKEAIALGDLSENSEYQEARTEQSFLEGRILELEEKSKNAQIIKEHKKGVGKVELGVKVTIVSAEKGAKDEATYVLVGSTEADPLNHRISNDSPVGRALMGKKVGDEVTVNAPNGAKNYRILKVE